MSDAVEEPDTNVVSADDTQRDSRLDSDKMKVSSADRRSPSPGLAKRVVEPATSNGDNPQPEATGNSADIDDLSKRLADSLLDRSVAVAQTSPSSKYVSMNDQRKQVEPTGISNESVQLELETEAPAAVHDSRMMDSVTIHAGNPPPSNENPLNGQLTNGTTDNAARNRAQAIQFGLWVSKENDLDHPWTVGLDSTPSPNIPKPSNGIGAQSLISFGASKDVNREGLTEERNLISTEVDVLTAISAQATPSSLPNVLDGLSDGEVSSDDSDDDDEVTNHSSHPVSQSNQLDSDPFFTTHQMIMNKKNSAQRQQISETLIDIRRSTEAGEVKPENVISTGGSDGRLEQTVTTPIWEIREAYAETLRAQEQKRRQRLEQERLYEEEYRERQLEELEAIEGEGKPPAAHPLEVEEQEEEPNTDYSSDEEGMMEHDLEISRGWSWGEGGSSKNYTKLSHDDSGERLSRISSTPGPPITGQSSSVQSSNASRLADHHASSSPRAPRRLNHRGESRLSNSSLNSYTSSSQSSSMAPSTVIRCKKSDEPVSDSSDSSSSAGSSDINGWNYKERESPTTQLRVGASGGSSGKSVGGTSPKRRREDGEYDTDEETDKLLHKPYASESKVEMPHDTKHLGEQAMKNKAKEVTVYDPDEPTVLIEGILFRAAYLGSTQLVSEAQPSKAIRMMQAQEAVGRIKALGTMHFGDHYQAPEGESQPSTDVDLFVSTEKVMVLNTDLQEIMMDHALRSISYIADIDSVLVIMAKRSMMTSSATEESPNSASASKQQKLICHIFETDEAHLIAQSIGQAFQVAYMEFLKANGIEEPNIQLKDTSYEDILEQQEIMNDELETFTRKDKNKEVIVPKSKGEPLGIVIVESGWGSVLPTVILANMSPTGSAARCGQLNIGDQIMSVNGISLVGLPLSTCQEHIKAVKNLTAVRLCVVSRPPVVEVLIRRPDRKYQLGFSVQNGVICSLLRGGIAERGGIRVGHRIIEINGQSVVAVTHDKIVQMLSTSVGEIHMKTMPMAVFRLLTGQEVPQYI